jgi:hypothetical protein
MEDRMRRLVFALLLVAAGTIAPQVHAADSKTVTPAPLLITPAPVVVETDTVVAAPIYVEKVPENIFEQPVLIPKPPARVQYGCKRVWRCDTMVCEWRRGCWGIYGYMEGPYYTEELAKRQWARDGLPTSEPRAPRSRAAIEPRLAK